MSYQINLHELSIAQQVFAVFYAIFFGTMLQMIGARKSVPYIDVDFQDKQKKKNAIAYLSKADVTIKESIKKNTIRNPPLNLFDSPNAWAIGFSFGNKPLLRLLISISSLNIVPALIFALVFLGLHDVKDPLQWWQVLLILWLSLAPQYIYRLMYAILARCYHRLFLKSDKCTDYNAYDLGAVSVLYEERLRFKSHASFLNHIAFPIFFYLHTSMLAYHFLSSQSSTEWMVCSSLTLLIVGVFLFFFNEPK